MDEGGAQRRRRLTRAESRERTRSELLDAAAEVFAAKGFAGASLDEIAERAGYTTGALYSNFENKEQLFLELLSARRSLALQRRVEAIAETLDRRLAEGADPFDAATEIFLAVADRNRELAPLQAEFWLYAVRHPEAMEVVAAKLAEQVDALERVLAAILERYGIVVGASTRELTTVVIGLFHGLVRQRRVQRAQVPDDLFATALRWLLAGMAHQQSAPTQVGSAGAISDP